MQFGVTLVQVNPLAAPRVARAAEELGYESVWLGEHLIWPAAIESEYPHGPPGTAQRLDPAVPTMDPWVLLATVAATTTKIRLGTNVFVLPLRHPFVTARAVTTLDVVSKGRVTVGIGAGWMKGEFDATGVDFRNRGRRTDECLAVLRTLWTQDVPQFEGEFFRFGPVRFQPKPVQRPGPPILVGGHANAALRRAANAEGWLGVGLAGEELRLTIRRLRALRAESPRHDEPMDITVLAPSAPTDAEVDQYRQAGVARLIVAPFERTRDAVPGLERFAERVFR